VADQAISEGPVGPRDEAVRLMAMTELELVAKGYPEPLVRATVARARGTAQWKVGAVRAEARDAAFLDTLRAELERAEAWVNQELSQVEHG